MKKLGHALDKHTHEEENVVYPALRQADDKYDADLLEGEHGYVKTYLYELDQMGSDAPNWLEKVREFRGMVEKHARMEEEEVFPRLKSGNDRRAERQDHEPGQQGRVHDGVTLALDGEVDASVAGSAPDRCAAGPASHARRPGKGCDAVLV